MKKLKKNARYYLAAIGALGVSAALLISPGNASAALPYQWTRITVSPTGGAPNSNMVSGASRTHLSMSNNGRYVLFVSDASNMTTGDTNPIGDLYVRDTVSNTTQMADVDSTGAQAKGGFAAFSISGNGRYVVFLSTRTTFTTNTSTEMWVYVKDLQTGAVTQIPSSGYSESAAISANGRYLAYNSSGNVYVRDMKTGTVKQLNKSTTGGAPNAGGIGVSMSCDGSVIAFNSDATNIVANDTNGQMDTFVVERNGGDVLTDITISGNGSADSSAGAQGTQVSCDSSTVGFVSAASNLVTGDTNASKDAFVYDIYQGTTTRVNTSTAGTESDHGVDPLSGITLSADGRHITFQSDASNLGVSGGFRQHSYLKDLDTGALDWIDTDSSSTSGSVTTSRASAVSPDGKYLSVVTGYSGMNAPTYEADSYIDAYYGPTGIPLTTL